MIKFSHVNFMLNLGDFTFYFWGTRHLAEVLRQFIEDNSQEIKEKCRLAEQQAMFTDSSVN